MSLALYFLCAALLFHGSSAQPWNEGFAITCMDSGSDVLYLTVSSTNLLLLEGGLPNGNKTKGSPPPASQSWSAYGGWPQSTFTLVNAKTGLYLEATATGLQLRAKSGTIAQLWHYDELGHLVASNGKYMSTPLDTNNLYAMNIGHATLEDPGKSKVSQRWTFLPTRDADMAFTGYISFLSPNYASSSPLLCVDASIPLVAGNNNAPVLKPCSPASGGQVVQLVPTFSKDFNRTWSYPAGLFQIKFPLNNLCLAAVKDAYEYNNNYAALVACDSYWAVTWWYVNSRSQLVNNMAIANSLQKGLCLSSEDDVTFGVKRCVFKQPSYNRFILNWIIAK